MPQREARRLGDAVDEYAQRRSSKWSPGSKTTITHWLGKLVHYVGASTWMASIGPERVEEMFTDPNGPIASLSMFGRPRAASTINSARSSVAGFFQYAHKRHWTSCDPMELVDPLAAPRAENRLVLSASQMLDLIGLAKLPVHRVIMLIQATTALRIGDASSLTVGQVDLTAGTISLVIDKNSKPVLHNVTTELDQAVRAWLVEYTTELARPLRAEDPLTPGLQYEYWRRMPDGRILQGGFWSFRHPLAPFASGSEMVGRYLKTAKATFPYATGWDLNREASHVLRRSCAVAFFEMLLAQGYDYAMEATRELLNHSSIRQTEMYLGVTRGRQIVRDTMRGQSFLGPDLSNVTSLAERRTATDV